MSADGTDTVEASPTRLRALLALLCGALALVVAGNSMLAIALPDLGADLGADQTELTWVIDAYALAFAALLLPAGIAADRIGRRTLLLVGLAVFAAANLASAFTPDASWLIAWRALAGVGAAAVFPVTLSALVDAYPPQRRAFAVAVWSGVSAAGAVLGTIVAGLLLEAFWWGSLLLLSGLLAAALLPGVAVLVAQRRDRTLSLDPVGAALSVVALAALVLGIVEAPQRGWASPEILGALAIAGIAGAAFVRHELRTAHPSLDVRAFAAPDLAAGSLVVGLQFFASLGLFVLAPQYLQLVRQQSPLLAALSLLVIPVGVGAGTGLASVLLRRSGPRVPAAGGLLAMASGFAVLAVLLGRDATPSLWCLAAGLLIFGVGFGLAVTPGTVLILDGLPPERRSVASAVNDLAREVGGVLGIAVLSSALVGAYRDAVEPALTKLPPQARDAATDGAGAALGAAQQLGPDGAALAAAARDAFAAGLSTASWIACGVLAAGAVACAVLVRAGTRAHT